MRKNYVYILCNFYNLWLCIKWFQKFMKIWTNRVKGAQSVERKNTQLDLEKENTCIPWLLRSSFSCTVLPSGPTSHCTIFDNPNIPLEQNTQTANENKQFKETKTFIYIVHTWLNKAFKGAFENRALSSSHAGSIKLRTVPFRRRPLPEFACC